MVPSKKVHRQITPRDLDILLALDRNPLTVTQLLKVSQTFEQPFQTPQRLRGRLQVLREGGWVRRWRYATASRGAAPDYYKVTLLGYRLLYGEDVQPPTKRYFSEVGLSHQHHTKCLADFIVHTAVSAHHRGIAMRGFARENTLRLDVGDEALYPDCAFDLEYDAGRLFHFFVELDNGTERVRSQKDVESWERKIRVYDRYQDQIHPERCRVLVVTTRSGERIDHILQTAQKLTSNGNRSLFYGICLAEYLVEDVPLFRPCFRDHRKLPVALLPCVVDVCRSHDRPSLTLAPNASV